MTDWKPDLFAHLDYREYLKAYYEAAKAHSSAFSYRWFSKKAGYASPNYLKLIIEGERNLTPESIGKFTQALDLNDDEARFFAALVQLNQAESDEERNAAYEQVAASRRFRAARRIDHSFFQYLSHWYIPAIREMTARHDFREDPTWISAQLVPRIPVEFVQQALDVLLELGFVVRDDAGRLTRGTPSLTTGHEVRSLAVANYHRQMMSRAADAIEKVDRELRDISALTVCVPMELVPQLKQRIQGFREVLLDLCDRATPGEAVYQINMQLFPLSLSDPKKP
jgi:uncharacterized protein (TIGR02147 family)